MNIHQVYTHCGSATAVVGGCYAMVMASVVPVNGTDHASLAGLIVAIAGLATAIGAQVQPLLKIYLDERREERIAAEARHDLANKLQVANIEIQLLKCSHDEMVKTVEYNRNLIVLMLHRHDLPSEAHPNPEKEYQDAREISARRKDG